MPGVEEVVGVGEQELARSAGEQRGEEVGEVLLHVGEGLPEHRHDLQVDGLDDAVQLAPARLDVLELGLQELVAFEQRVVLLERERVDRAHEPQLAVEVAGAAGEGGAGGDLGCGRVERDRRLDVVLGAQLLDRGFEPHAGLGFVDVAPLQQLAHLEQLLLGGGARRAQLLQLVAGGRGPLGLGPARGAPAGQHRVDAFGQLGEPTADGLVPEPAVLERDPVLLGFGATLRVARESVVDLGQAVLEHLPAFGELRGAHVELAALAGHRGGALVELELHQRARLEQRLGFGGVGFEHGNPHLERRDALDVGLALRLQRLLLRRDRGELHLTLRALGLHAGTRPLDAVELVDRAPLGVGGRSFVASASVEIGAGGVERLAHDHADFVGFLGARCARRRARRGWQPGRRHPDATNRGRPAGRRAR